jgi:hypothetical protein
VICLTISTTILNRGSYWINITVNMRKESFHGRTVSTTDCISIAVYSNTQPLLYMVNIRRQEKGFNKAQSKDSNKFRLLAKWQAELRWQRIYVSTNCLLAMLAELTANSFQHT